MNNIKSAIEAKEKNQLYEWLLELLQITEATNKDLINYLTNHRENLNGPTLISAQEVQRTIGPEQGILNKESVDQFSDKVNNIVEMLRKNPEEEPVLFAEKFESIYYLLDGNHTFEALKVLERDKVWIVYTEDTVISNLLKN